MKGTFILVYLKNLAMKLLLPLGVLVFACLAFLAETKASSVWKYPQFTTTKGFNTG